MSRLTYLKAKMRRCWPQASSIDPTAVCFIPSSFSKASWKGSDTVDGGLRLSSSIFTQTDGPVARERRNV